MYIQSALRVCAPPYTHDAVWHHVGRRSWLKFLDTSYIALENFRVQASCRHRKCDFISEIRLRHKMRIYLKSNNAQFHPDSTWTIWNNNIKNNKMSSDMRSVPDLKMKTKANKRIYWKILQIVAFSPKPNQNIGFNDSEDDDASLWLCIKQVSANVCGA